jgi:hypothetical protein
MTTLKQMYYRYLETQVPGSFFEVDLCTGKYLCWSVPHQQQYTIYNWLGKVMGQGISQTRRYVWLGNKGAVYVTKSSKFEKKEADDTDIVLPMKKWVWKTYFNIDL